MSIKPMIYDNLTPQQRLIATIEALARDDDEEHERLVQSCPKKHYTQPDYQYSGMLQLLTAQAISIENGLTGDALNLMLCIYPKIGEEKHIVNVLQGMINLHAAWQSTLMDMGIDPKSMASVTAKVRHPMVKLMLEWEGLPEPDADAVLHIKSEMEALLQKIRNV